MSNPNKPIVIFVKQDIGDGRSSHYIFLNGSCVLNDILIANHINPRIGVKHLAIANRIYASLGVDAKLIEVELSEEDQIKAEKMCIDMNDILSMVNLKLNSHLNG